MHGRRGRLGTRDGRARGGRLPFRGYRRDRGGLFPLAAAGFLGSGRHLALPLLARLPLLRLDQDGPRLDILGIEVEHRLRRHQGVVIALGGQGLVRAVEPHRDQAIPAGLLRELLAGVQLGRHAHRADLFRVGSELLRLVEKDRRRPSSRRCPAACLPARSISRSVAACRPPWRCAADRRAAPPNHRNAAAQEEQRHHQGGPARHEKTARRGPAGGLRTGASVATVSASVFEPAAGIGPGAMARATPEPASRRSSPVPVQLPVPPVPVPRPSR